MNDRELLEAAAKAAGIEIDFSHTNGGGRFNTGFDAAGNAVLDWLEYKTWNPLTDDGDAFRLAASLRLNMQFGHEDVNVFRYCAPHCDVQERGDRTPSGWAAATRRAIVRAAAYIGAAS